MVKVRDVRQSPPKNIFGGRPADPRGTGRSPRESAAEVLPPSQ